MLHSFARKCVWVRCHVQYCSHESRFWFFTPIRCIQRSKTPIEGFKSNLIPRSATYARIDTANLLVDWCIVSVFATQLSPECFLVLIILAGRRSYTFAPLRTRLFHLEVCYRIFTSFFEPTTRCGLVWLRCGITQPRPTPTELWLMFHAQTTTSPYRELIIVIFHTSLCHST